MTRSNRAAGEGSVFKLPGGRWRAQVRFRDSAGKRFNLTKTVRTKGEAVEELAKLRNEAARRQRTLSDQSVSDYLTTWHAQRVAKGVIRAKTIEIESRHVARIVAIIGRERLERLERRHVFEVLDHLDAGELKGKARSLQQVLATLRRALRDAVSRSRLQYNPAAGIEHSGLRPAKRPVRRSFTPEELRAILKAVDQPIGKDTVPDIQFACLIHLLAHGGLRIGEALALQWRDVDLPAGTVRIAATLVEAAGKVERGEPKTFASRRVVRLPASVIERLRVLRGSTGTVFRVDGLVFSTAGTDGSRKQRAGERPRDRKPAPARPLRVSNVLRRRWHPILKSLSIEPCGFHALRHSHASMLIARAGVDPVTVAERLGHSDPGMTLRVYSHPDEERSSSAADAFASAIAEPPKAATDEGAQ